MLLVDEFMIELFNGEASTQSDEVLWGMSYKCDVANLNDGIRTERIGLFPMQIFSQINDLILHLLIKRIDFRGKFNAFHKTLFGYDMPEFFYEEVMAEVYKAKLADRFTIPNYAQAMKRVIQSHPDLYRVHFIDE